MPQDPYLPGGCSQDDIDREADPHFRETGEWPWAWPRVKPMPAVRHATQGAKGDDPSASAPPGPSEEAPRVCACGFDEEECRQRVVCPEPDPDEDVPPAFTGETDLF